MITLTVSYHCSGVKQTHMFQGDLRMARLLVIGGCKLSPLRQWTTRYVTHRRRKEQEMHADWLMNVSRNPMRLQYACREEIRSQLGPERAHLAGTLPLPKRLIGFVELCDLESFDDIELC